MTMNILIVDDEERIRRVLADFFKREGFGILEAKDGEEAVELYDLQKDHINLVILDVMIPGIDGWGVLRHIRSSDTDMPVMMLTAKTQDGDQIYGFEAGADDYVTKPVSPIVLVARVKALLKRSTDKMLAGKTDFDGITVDQLGHRVCIDGTELDLSPKEYDLLVYLTNNHGIALPREQLVNVVWGYDYFGDMRTLDTHIKNLRAKMGEKGACIKTLRGYGYKFDV